MNIDETKIADKLVNKVIKDNEIIEIHGIKITKNKTTRLIILTGEHEPSVTTLIEKELKKGMTVLNVGANFGWFTMISSKLVGKTGHVYSFEPDPQIMKALKDNVKLNDLENVSFLPLAVSNKSGKANLAINSRYPTRNRVDSKTLFQNTIDIDITSIDEFCEQNNLKIDFVIMDIEGSEVRAIEGMKKTFLKNPKIKMIVEFHPKAIPDVGSLPENFIALLEQNGLTFELIEKHKNGVLKPITKKQLLESKNVNLFCHK